MKILALEREIPGALQEQYHLFGKEEARTAWKLYQGGVIRELYFRADQPTAVLVLECESTEEAERILLTLPFVREGLIGFDLIPLKAYPGFSRLFEAGERLD